MSLQEKGCILQLVVTLLERAMEQESILPAKMMHHCQSLTSMGAGTLMGWKNPPPHAAPGNMRTPHEFWSLWGGSVGAGTTAESGQAEKEATSIETTK